MKLYTDELKELGKKDNQYCTSAERDHTIKAFNTYCGDKFVLYTSGESALSQSCFSGHGCLVSKAAAALAVELIDGLKWSEVKVLSDGVIDYLQGNADLGKLDPRFTVFAPVRDYPGRYDCAALAWEELNKYASKQEFKGK